MFKIFTAQKIQEFEQLINELSSWALGNTNQQFSDIL